MSSMSYCRFQNTDNYLTDCKHALEAARIATYTQLEPMQYFSKRFLMKRYLGLTEQEMSENEMLFAEEAGDIEVAPVANPNLGGVGLSQGTVQNEIEGLGPTNTENMTGDELGAGGPNGGGPQSVGAQGGGPGGGAV